MGRLVGQSVIYFANACERFRRLIRQSRDNLKDTFATSPMDDDMQTFDNTTHTIHEHPKVLMCVFFNENKKLNNLSPNKTVNHHIRAQWMLNLRK